MKHKSCLMLLIVVAAIVVNGSRYGRIVAAQNNNPFLGTWQPAAEEGVTPRLEYLEIKEDNTFLMKAKADSGRGNLNGTYTIKDGKMLLQAEEFKKHHDEPVGTIGDDGRLKLVMNSEDKGHYLIKK